MRYSRRRMLRLLGTSLGGLAAAPALFQRALAAGQARTGKVLVVIFQRGAADGLSIVPPYADGGYARLRPTLALSAPGSGENAALRLDDRFGLHPRLSPLLPWFERRSLAVVHGVGSPHSTRSHFDAQDFLESGTPGVKATSDGWLNRVLQTAGGTNNALRAVAVQPQLPRLLRGAAAATSFDGLDRFVLPGGAKRSGLSQGFDELYQAALDQALRSTGEATFDALERVDRVRKEQRAPQNEVRYPRSPLGKRLSDIARLIHGEVGVQLAVTECGGWDTHIAQGTAAKGALANRLEDLGLSLGAFAQDLGARMDDVCLVTLTEFGRAVQENGNGGTDHGTGSVMLVLGGSVDGGRVFERWKPLTAENLFEGRDLPATIDYREVLAALLRGHLGLTHLKAVFPGYALPEQRLEIIA